MLRATTESFEIEKYHSNMCCYLLYELLLGIGLSNKPHNFG